MKDALVSVIMSTYNGSKYIKEAIDSVLGQSYENFEFIIINDCSTDNVEKIILEYVKKDNRIVYIKNNKNLKLTKSLNKGLEIAKGDYIARIDDDDIWCDKSKLEKQVEFMEGHSDYGLIGTNVIIIDFQGKEINKVKNRETNDNIKEHLLQSNQFAHSSVLYRKSILSDIGYYDSKWNLTEDYDLWLRIGRDYKLYNLQVFGLKYRFLENSVMRKKSFKRRFMAFKLCFKNRKYYPNFLKSVLLRIPHLLLSDKLFSTLLKIKDRYF